MFFGSPEHLTSLRYMRVYHPTDDMHKHVVHAFVSYLHIIFRIVSYFL